MNEETKDRLKLFLTYAVIIGLFGFMMWTMFSNGKNVGMVEVCENMGLKTYIRASDGIIVCDNISLGENIFALSPKMVGFNFSVEVD